MTHRRRLTRGLPPARKAQGWMPVEVLATEKQTPTVVIAAVTPEPPALTEVITESQQQAERGETTDLGTFAEWAEEYSREPVPDLDSPDPADRTAYLRELGGDEFVFESVVRDLHAGWLLDTSLPVPPRPAVDIDPSPEAIPPPADATASGASGLDKDTGSGATTPTGEDRDQTAPAAPEPVPADDEPEAEQDCAEGDGNA